MSRPKGTPKTGGRKKGTPNKSGALVKERLSALLSGYMDSEEGQLSKMEEDLNSLLPIERIRAYTALMAYIAPKQQAITLEEQAEAEERALTRWIEEAPDEAIDAIAAKVLQIQQTHRAEAS